MRICSENIIHIRMISVWTWDHLKHMSDVLLACDYAMSGKPQQEEHAAAAASQHSSSSRYALQISRVKRTRSSVIYCGGKWTRKQTSHPNEYSAEHSNTALLRTSAHLNWFDNCKLIWVRRCTGSKWSGYSKFTFERTFLKCMFWSQSRPLIIHH